MTGRDGQLRKDLARAGISEEVAQAALDIDAHLQRWRRRIVQRELGQNALRELELGLDMAQLDVLVAVRAPANEFGTETSGETMVSTVADRLGIDPSRASRVISELIRQGLVRRAVSQADARRTIVELTEAGTRILDAVRTYKFLILGSFLKDWTAEEIAIFLPLYERFSAWYDRAERLSEPVASEVAELRHRLTQEIADLDAGPKDMLR